VVLFPVTALTLLGSADKQPNSRQSDGSTFDATISM
jgi:hypothetical protein